MSENPNVDPQDIDRGEADSSQSTREQMLMKEACSYASMKVAEVESKAQSRQGIHYEQPHSVTFIPFSSLRRRPKVILDMLNQEPGVAIIIIASPGSKSLLPDRLACNSRDHSMRRVLITPAQPLSTTCVRSRRSVSIDSRVNALTALLQQGDFC